MKPLPFLLVVALSSPLACDSEGGGLPTCSTDSLGGDSCEDVGASCVTDTQRCSCRIGAGAHWSCDPIACPETVDGGTSCDSPGLRCGSDFEDPGALCVAPENMWVSCRRVQSWEGDYRPWCSYEEPDEGDVCCVFADGGIPDECPYPGVAYRCVGNHWKRVE